MVMSIFLEASRAFTIGSLDLMMAMWSGVIPGGGIGSSQMWPLIFDSNFTLHSIFPLPFEMSLACPIIIFNFCSRISVSAQSPQGPYSEVNKDQIRPYHFSS